jgi:hypothetical protein
VSIPRRLGRLARGLVSGLGEEDRFRETLRLSRERSETLRDAFGAAWRSASEELRAAEARDREREAREAEDGEAEDAGRRRSYRQTAEEYIRDWEERQREARRRGDAGGWRGASTFVPLRYPPEVIKAYGRLGLDTGAPIDEVNRKRRDLVRRYHPDRFSDPEKRVRAERLTAEINASHDVIERHLLRK